MKSIISIFIFSFLSFSVYSQVEDSLLKAHPTEMIVSNGWMDFMTSNGQKTIIAKEKNRYFLYEYDLNNRVIFKSEVESFFVIKIVTEEDPMTGYRQMVSSYCEAIRAHGKRIHYNPETGKVLSVSKYRHGQRIRYKRIG